MDHVARPNDVQQVLRIIGMGRVFHCIEVVEVAEELVEAVDRWQELVAIAEVILAELAGGITLRLESGGNRAGFRRQSHFCAGLSDSGHPRANWQLTRNKVRATCRATCLGIVVGEQHSLLGQLIEIRRPPGHHAPVVCAYVPHANVVAHDEDDVRFFTLRVCHVGRA